MQTCCKGFKGFPEKKTDMAKMGDQRSKGKDKSMKKETR